MLELTDQNFEKEINSSLKMVLVDFYTDWCPACKTLAGTFLKLSEEFGDKFIFSKVNLDNAPIVSGQLGIDRIPMVVLFSKGQPVDGFIGALSENMIKDWLNKNLNHSNDAEIEKIIEEAEEYAKENGLKINPNIELVKRLAKGLLENRKKHGEKYCPCRRVTGNADEDRPKICPCQFSKKEIEEQGHCLCQLFQK